MSVPPAAALQLSTLADCGLTIAGYPRFRYDARGGGGNAQLGPPRSDGLRPLSFPAAGLRIPPLDWRSTRVLGLPLPPGLSIAIEPEELEGIIDPASGSLALNFRARFLFRVGSLPRTGPARGHPAGHRRGQQPAAPALRPAAERRWHGPAGGGGHNPALWRGLAGSVPGIAR